MCTMLEDGRIDVVGDVHGTSDCLSELLGRLGYVRDGRGWRHPDARRLVFVGDYIDRGSDPLGTVRLVRQLCDDGVALALMGNHDANALQFSLRCDGDLDPAAAHEAARSVLNRGAAPQGGWLRDHRLGSPGALPKNIDQHKATILGTDAAGYASIVRWAASLPAWLELPGLRVVHAAWIPQAMVALDRWCYGEGIDSLGITASGIDEAITIQAARASLPARSPGPHHWRRLLDLEGHEADASPPDRSIGVALERVLKGAEARLPPGVSFADPDGHSRDAVRVRWFEAGEGRTFAEHALMTQRVRSCIARDTQGAKLGPSFAGLIPMTPAEAYPSGACPVIFGHYGLERSDLFVGWPHNVGCVDLKAFRSSGELACYRWEGERTLRPDHLVSVPGNE